MRTKKDPEREKRRQEEYRAEYRERQKKANRERRKQAALSARMMRRTMGDSSDVHRPQTPQEVDPLEWLSREQQQGTEQDGLVAAALAYIDEVEKAKTAESTTTANEPVDKQRGSPCQATMDAATEEYARQDHAMLRASAKSLWGTVVTTRQAHHPDVDRSVFGRRFAERILKDALQTYLPGLEKQDVRDFIDQALENEDEVPTWMTYLGNRVMTYEKFTTWWDSHVEKGSARREEDDHDDSSEEETTSGEGGSGRNVRPRRK